MYIMHALLSELVCVMCMHVCTYMHASLSELVCVYIHVCIVE